MNSETETALRKSITHWWDNCVQVSARDTPDISSQSCALCAAFDYDDSCGCTGCPVYEHTGFALCHDTPYRDVLDLRDVLYRRYKMSNDAASCRLLLDSCFAELRFLESLLPPEGQYYG